MDILKLHKKLILFLTALCLLSFSCNRGTGCPAEDANTKTNKKGMPTSKAKSGLFDKKTTKKINKSSS
ncbi:MAG: hypothetical protein IPM34_12510 [Saprospiraceae bacterium]|nr:hypothetical protein [Saprospiraceae bacterium]